MDNYICINGKKAELTEEQMKALGIELPKANPFKRVQGKSYYYINGEGKLGSTNDNAPLDTSLFNIANYCTDKAIMKQRALHETLNRLLWRYSMENGGEGNWEIARKDNGEFITQNCIWTYFGQSFSTEKIASNAIEEIIKPFLAAHPDFKF